MPLIDTAAISEKLQGLVDKVPEDKATLAAAGAAIVLGGALVWRACSGSSDYKKKPTVFELSGGSIERGEVKKEWDNYEASYGKEAGAGIKDRSKTTQLVDVFYSLVTDIYEWGWGQSFHFSPKLPGKNWASSEAAHEARVAATLGLKPGMKCLDVGCGVGGPMRTIAAVSGAHITGITINQYQVRGTALRADGGDSRAWWWTQSARVTGGFDRPPRDAPRGGWRGGAPGARTSMPRARGCSAMGCPAGCRGREPPRARGFTAQLAVRTATWQLPTLAATTQSPYPAACWRSEAAPVRRWSPRNHHSPQPRSCLSLHAHPAPATHNHLLSALHACDRSLTHLPTTQPAAPQVDRATTHNARLGLASLTDVVRGNFLEMPFDANTFDAAYAIEATCHAAKLEEVRQAGCHCDR